MKGLEEGCVMEIDMIVVLVLALMFFGGVVWLVIKERNKEKPLSEGTPALVQNNQQRPKKAKTR